VRPHLQQSSGLLVNPVSRRGTASTPPSCPTPAARLLSLRCLIVRLVLHYQHAVSHHHHQLPVVLPNTLGVSFLHHCRVFPVADIVHAPPPPSAPARSVYHHQVHPHVAFHLQMLLLLRALPVAARLHGLRAVIRPQLRLCLRRAVTLLSLRNRDVRRHRRLLLLVKLHHHHRTAGPLDYRCDISHLHDRVFDLTVANQVINSPSPPAPSPPPSRGAPPPLSHAPS